MKFLRLLLAAAGVVWTAALAWPALASPAVSPRALAVALAPWATKVEASARLHGPSTSPDGQFVVTLREGHREVGLIVLRQLWPFAEAPIFWINLVADSGQAVLVPRDGKLVIDHIPADWIASDYLHDRKPTRAMSFLALNPRRTLVEAGGRVTAKTEYIEAHPVTRHLLARTTWWVSPKQDVVALTVLVHRAANEREAETLAKAIEARFWGN